MTRPYWLTDAKTENGVYLGFTKGQWPIQAFSADNTHHLSWAAEDPDNRVLIGPVPIPDDAPTWRGKKIPAAYALAPLYEVDPDVDPTPDYDGAAAGMGGGA